MIGQPKHLEHAGSAPQWSRRQTQWASRLGFTLVEMLAVVMVILLLAGLMIGVAGYVQKNMAITTTKAQIAALSAALESYKADWGHYPATTIARISSSGFWESTNNWIMYRALSGANGGKQYLRFSTSQLRVSIASGGGSNGGLTNIVDAWGMPYNYYCSPSTVFALVNNKYILTNYPAANTSINDNNGYSAGGQVNGGSFDLFSYGPDHATFVATNLAYGSWNDGPWINTGFKTNSAANDDITNFKR